MSEDPSIHERVRDLRAQHYAPAEIARVLRISKCEATRLVRAVAAQTVADAAAAGEGGQSTQCWVNPGWSHGLSIAGHDHWPRDARPASEATGSGVAVVMVATPAGHDRLEVCTFLVDTWCLGVKNAMGPTRVRTRRLDEIRRQCYLPWRSAGLPAPLELGQHLVLGAVEFAQRLGFEPHPDFRAARPALGSREGPSAITFGLNGTPHYINGPYDDPRRVLATLERNVGRDGFHYTVAVGEADDPGDGFSYSVTRTARDEPLRDAA